MRGLFPAGISVRCRRVSIKVRSLPKQQPEDLGEVGKLNS